MAFVAALELAVLENNKLGVTNDKCRCRPSREAVQVEGNAGDPDKSVTVVSGCICRIPDLAVHEHPRIKVAYTLNYRARLANHVGAVMDLVVFILYVCARAERHKDSFALPSNKRRFECRPVDQIIARCDEWVIHLNGC
ncbi:hypothetical protein D3C76_674470 [compost metagenome]